MSLSVFRHFQDRHRPLEFAHHGTDERGAELCAGAGRPGSAGSDGAGIGSTVRLVGAHRSRPLHRPGDASWASRASAPDTIDPKVIEPTLARIRGTGRIRLLGRREIAFDEPLNLLFHVDQVLPGHSNGMRFTAHDEALRVLAREEYYSIGGGFVVQAGDRIERRRCAPAPAPTNSIPGRGLLELGRPARLENPRTHAGPGTKLVQRCRHRCAARAHLAGDAGLRASRLRGRRGCCPGVLGVRRRAPEAVSPAHERRSVERDARPRLGQCLRPRRQRGKRRRRTGRHRADQRRGRNRARGAALLPPLRTGR